MGASLERANSRIKSKKRCCVCGVVKPRQMFYLYKYTTNQGKQSVRLDSRCRECALIRRKQRWHTVEKGDLLLREKNTRYKSKWKSRRRALSNPLREPVAKKCSKCGEWKEPSDFYRKTVSRDWLTSWCRACTCIQNADYVRRNRDKHKVWWKKTMLKQRYGITLDEYHDLLEFFEHKCVICSKKEDLCIDHDHETGDIRGILCRPCNLAVANIGENAENARRLVKYIEASC